MELIAVLAVLLLIGGSIAGLLAFISLRSTREELRNLQTKLARLDADVSALALSEEAKEADQPASSSDALEPSGDAQFEESPGFQEQTRDPDPLSDSTTWEETAEPARVDEYIGPHPIVQNLQDNWMIWLGGACVALAGIFLVRYSIEQGLLGPTARFVAGLATGLGLHAAAEYFRRKTGSIHPSFAAMAGAGSITLFATLLVGLRLFELISPATAFVLMAMVAVFTMAMAYIHGPVLAAFGILGAYLVPILTSSGGGQVVIAMIYALIISASALMLLRYVYRPWLWAGFLAGAFGWWLISLGDSNGDSFRAAYLTILAYLIVAIPGFDWTLSRRVEVLTDRLDRNIFKAVEDETERRLPLVFGLLAVAYGFTIYDQATYMGSWVVSLPFFVLSFFIARGREQLLWLPWVLLLGQCVAWILPLWHLTGEGWELEQLTQAQGLPFLRDLLVCGLVTVLLSLWNWNTCRFKALWASLATVGPFLLLTLGYLLTSRLTESWYWSLGTALPAMAVMALATTVRRTKSIDSLAVWLFVAGHYGLALAASMLFNEASLTLAIALQMVSLAWIIRSFELPALDWLLKLVVGIVIIRLTFNPWLATYPSEIHWPLYSYGGATLCAVGAMFLLKATPSIAKWCEAAALHLFVLTLFAELRYLFHEGEVFASDYTFIEACSYMALFAALGLVYYRRSLVSETLRRLYELFSVGLIVLGLLNYLLIGWNTLEGDSWIVGSIDTTPIFNMVLVAYGVPVIAGLLYTLFYVPRHRKKSIAFSALALFILISIEIRHLWAGTIDLGYPAMSDGELYTYSAVWLVIAIGTILAGSWRLGQDCYRAGMALLAIVIAKLFLVDMSGLEGLLRVASFMGLGLSLLAISYIHQKLTAQKSGLE
jgi:uncharacterized membrane protein